MKKKKNIVKKTSANLRFTFLYKKSIKHYFKEIRFKNKFFAKILLNFKSFSYINNLAKYFKFNKFNISKKFLVNKSIYFNYITNGLDLKYDDHTYQDLYQYNFFNHFYIRKSIILNTSELDIIKCQKFINLIDYNYVDSIDILKCTQDYFLLSNLLFNSLLIDNYSINQLSILKLINKYF